MRWFLDRLKGKKKREAEEALARLEEQATKGPEAARRFEEATRRILTAPKRGTR